MQQTTKAIVIDVHGAPEVMQWRDWPLAEPAPGTVLLRHEAIGLNFIDTYHRSGLYPLALPAVLGMEAAGVIEAVGEGVALQAGERVAYLGQAAGAYAERRMVPADWLVRLPEEVSCQQAAATLLKGLTVHMLLHRVYPVGDGTVVLAHAAAGGVGQLLVPWAKHLGATVIGTAGDAAKATVAKDLGADEVILYREQDVAARVRALTGGKGCHVVYDGVGSDTFTASLDSLRPFGMIVSFGQASGKVPPLELGELAKRGSLMLARPTVMDYVRDAADYRRAAAELFDLLAGGVLPQSQPAHYPLKDASIAHRALEARKTTGSVILLP